MGLSDDAFLLTKVRLFSEASLVASGTIDGVLRCFQAEPPYRILLAV